MQSKNVQNKGGLDLFEFVGESLQIAIYYRALGYLSTKKNVCFQHTIKVTYESNSK
jgi:hypothetical protein